MKIDVIGGSGFIGNKLCEILEKEEIDYQILDIAINPKYKTKTIHCDITNIKDLENNLSGDVVINLAAVHRDDVKPKSLYDEVNVEGSRNICKVAITKNIKKIIFISSVAIYGFAPRNTKENGIPKPFNDYGRTKLEAEKIYQNWYETSDDLALTIIRPTVVFGENNRGNVYNFLNQINKKYFPMIGDGKNKKSMAYVNNVAAFIKHSIGFEERYHLYNYIDKPDMTMNELVHFSRAKMNRSVKPVIKIPYNLAVILGYVFDFISLIIRSPLPISSIRIKKFCSDSQFETSITKSGFEPTYLLSEGLKKTIEHEFVEDNSSDHKFISE
jgi:nucleoside-diphosphate-sugar epimerase